MTKIKGTIIKVQISEAVSDKLWYLTTVWGANKKDLASDILEQAVNHTFDAYQHLLLNKGETNGLTAGAEESNGNVQQGGE